jgi:hypothetical protein
MKPLKSNPAKTVLTITLGFLVIFLVTKQNWALLTSLLVGFSGLISTYLASKIEFLWFKLAWLLSKIVPNILLGLVFYLFLFPMALLSRLFGQKDPMHLKNKYPSLFKDVNKTFSPETFDNPW